MTVTMRHAGLPDRLHHGQAGQPRARRLLVIAVLLPLWASYVAKVYAWRTILAEDGSPELGAARRLPGRHHRDGTGLVGPWIVLTYLWLPYMILPIYAGLERIPDSLIDASFDLGASPFMTFRKVILPLAFPAIVGRVDLHLLADAGRLHHAARWCRRSQFIGNVIYDQLGVGGNLPFAAAYVTVPMVIMVVYLLVARRLGAFENL